MWASGAEVTKSSGLVRVSCSSLRATPPPKSLRGGTLPLTHTVTNPRIGSDQPAKAADGVSGRGAALQPSPTSLTSEADSVRDLLREMHARPGVPICARSLWRQFMTSRFAGDGAVDLDRGVQGLVDAGLVEDRAAAIVPLAAYR